MADGVVELCEMPRALRSATVHSLPCTIAHNGPAPVSGYFAPLIEAAESGTVTSALRGHGLRGRTVPLPADFIGVVYKEHRAVYSDQQVGGHACIHAWLTVFALPSQARSWTPASRFRELTYWNRTTAPSKGNKSATTT